MERALLFLLKFLVGDYNRASGIEMRWGKVSYVGYPYQGAVATLLACPMPLNGVDGAACIAGTLQM